MRYKDIIERSNAKLPPLGRIPTKLAFFISLPKGVQQIKKRSKDIHLPIVSISDKAFTPPMGITG
jgi:hypothetical protein